MAKRTIHDLKRERMHTVKKILHEVKAKDIPYASFHHDFAPLRGILPTMYIELLFNDDDRIKGDVRCREGFVLNIDAHSFAVVGGKYFKSEGYSTYQESELSLEQVKEVMKVYEIEDVKFYFCQCLAQAPRDLHLALQDIMKIQ